jgi:hypothetical protein
VCLLLRGRLASDHCAAHPRDKTGTWHGSTTLSLRGHQSVLYEAILRSTVGVAVPTCPRTRQTRRVARASTHGSALVPMCSIAHSGQGCWQRYRYHGTTSRGEERGCAASVLCAGEHLVEQSVDARPRRCWWGRSPASAVSPRGGTPGTAGHAQSVSSAMGKETSRRQAASCCRELLLSRMALSHQAPLCLSSSRSSSFPGQSIVLL